jgi:uncharacterized protein YndB with AHSA1/START domain
MTTKTNTKVQVHKVFDATPGRVFDAWFDRSNIARWLFVMDRDVGQVKMDPRPEGTFSFTVRRDGKPVEHVGRYIKIDRPRFLSFTWDVPSVSKESTTVTVTCQIVDTGTKLTLIQENVPAENEKIIASGWNKVLLALESEIRSSLG